MTLQFRTNFQVKHKPEEDKTNSTLSFVIDAFGTRNTRETLPQVASERKSNVKLVKEKVWSVETGYYIGIFKIQNKVKIRDYKGELST